MVDYPKQIFCIWGGNQSSLSATFELMQPKKEGMTAPLEMHEGNLSRFAITLLDTSTGATIPLTANIPAKDIPIIGKKTMTAMLLKEMDSSNKESEDADVSLCYTQEIKFGACKGKTPAAALLENSNNRAELEKVKKLLMENVKKYPGNQTQIDAIETAILLFDTGELKKDGEKTSGSKNKVEIYDRKFKSTRKKNSKGNYLCYSINITCEFNMNYPWRVTIENYYAPSAEGKIDYKKIEDRKKASIRLSDDDWALCVSQFENLKQFFETICFKELYLRAYDFQRQNIEKAKAQQNDAS